MELGRIGDAIDIQGLHHEIVSREHGMDAIVRVSISQHVRQGMDDGKFGFMIVRRLLVAGNHGHFPETLGGGYQKGVALVREVVDGGVSRNSKRG